MGQAICLLVAKLHGYAHAWLVEQEILRCLEVVTGVCTCRGKPAPGAIEAVLLTVKQLQKIADRRVREFTIDLAAAKGIGERDSGFLNS